MRATGNSDGDTGHERVWDDASGWRVCQLSGDSVQMSGRAHKRGANGWAAHGWAGITQTGKAHKQPCGDCGQWAHEWGANGCELHEQSQCHMNVCVVETNVPG